MNIEITTVFAIGIAVFSIASMYFLVAHKKSFNSAFLVSFITIISYVLMLEGSLASIKASGEVVHMTRWLFYGLSCTLLMYEIARFLKKSLSETIFLLYLTVIVMGTGAASAYFDGWYMIGFFAISSVAYGLMLYHIFRDDIPERKLIAKYILLGWTGFPVAFLLAPDGFGIITAASAAVLYLLFDIFTKIIFYLELYPKMSKE